MTANEFAKKQGYAGAQYLHKWRGYKCYDPLFKAGEDEGFKRRISP